MLISKKLKEIGIFASLLRSEQKRKSHIDILVELEEYFAENLRNQS